MTTLSEHDYISFSEASSMARASDSDRNAKSLKETELRLGLPGSHSPERSKSTLVGVSVFGKDLEFSLSPSKNGGHASGAKRGFSHVINGGKWVLSKPEAEGSLAKEGAVEGMFSPRSGISKNDESAVKSYQSAASKPVTKEGFAVNPQPKPLQGKKSQVEVPAAKAQVVGWPPIRSFRKNTMASNMLKNSDGTETKSELGCLFIKVSLDGAPYLRKVDLKTYANYAQLSMALEKMFGGFKTGQSASSGLSGRDSPKENWKDCLHGSEYVLTYEDKDGDWMLVGDVPWKMFTDSCRRLRILKSSEAIGLAPRAMEKFKNRE